jgi:hypothetical protein
MKEARMALNIKVLGPGCYNCQRVEQQAVKALEALAVKHPKTEATIQHVTDYAAIRKYPILATPGLVINENLVCGGRIPAVEEVLGWLEGALGDAKE